MKIIPTTAPPSKATPRRNQATHPADRRQRHSQNRSRILVDTTLFPDGPREGGTGVVMSSIIVNDNVIDLIVTPAAKSGETATLVSTPQTSYIKFVDHVTTGPAESKSDLDISDPATNSDGTVTITVNGIVALGSQPTTAAAAVPSPTKFAQTVLTETIAASGISIKPPKHAAPRTSPPSPGSTLQKTKSPNTFRYRSRKKLKVTLKVSQNLHAGRAPIFWERSSQKIVKIRCKPASPPSAPSCKTPSSISPASPKATAQAATGPTLQPRFYLPIPHILDHSPRLPCLLQSVADSWQRRHARKNSDRQSRRRTRLRKTGTFGSEDRLNANIMLNGKGLAGYVITASGEKIAFAAYVITFR